MLVNLYRLDLSLVKNRPSEIGRTLTSPWKFIDIVDLNLNAEQLAGFLVTAIYWYRLAIGGEDTPKIPYKNYRNYLHKIITVSDTEPNYSYERFLHYTKTGFPEVDDLLVGKVYPTRSYIIILSSFPDSNVDMTVNFPTMNFLKGMRTYYDLTGIPEYYGSITYYGGEERLRPRMIDEDIEPNIKNDILNLCDAYEIPEGIFIFSTEFAVDIYSKIRCVPGSIPKILENQWYVLRCGSDEGEWNRLFFITPETKVEWYQWDEEGQLTERNKLLRGSYKIYEKRKREHLVARFLDGHSEVALNPEEAKQGLLSGSLFVNEVTRFDGILMRGNTPYSVVNISNDPTYTY